MGWQDRFSISRKTALVTGATSGTGAEITRVFAEAGTAVIASDRPCERLSQTAAETGAETIAADISAAAGCESLTREARSRYSRTDILVNSPGPLLSYSAEGRDMTMTVNLGPPFLLTRAFAPGERRKDHQHLFADRSHRAGRSCSLRGFQRGLNALTKSLMAELAPHNIKVNAICPTVVMTEMGRKIWSPPEKSGPMIAGTLLGRFGKQVEAADMALYLASPASDLVNGAVMMIERGYSSV